MASWYYSTAGKNITEILKKADSDVRYAAMKECLTSEQITLPHYAILYNDIEILQCAMEGFKSEQKYDVLKQKMCHGSTSTLEFIIEVLAGLKKSSSVEIETLWSTFELLLEGLSSSDLFELFVTTDLLLTVIECRSVKVIIVFITNISVDCINTLLLHHKGGNQTALEIIMSNSDVKMLKAFRKKLDTNSWFGMLMQPVKAEKPVVLLATESESAEPLLMCMLEELSAEQVLKVFCAISIETLLEPDDMQNNLQLVAALASNSLKSQFLQKQSKDGDTAFHLSAMYRNTTLVKELLEGLTEKNTFEMLKITNKAGYTALHMTLLNSGADSEDMAMLMVKRVTRLDCNTLVKILHKNRTAIHFAAQSGSAKVLKYILDILSPRELLNLLLLQDDSGKTALHYAVANGKPSSLVKSILYKLTNLEKHTLLSIQCKKKMTAVHCAPMGNTEVVAYVLQDLAEHQLYNLALLADENGDTILHKAFRGLNSHIITNVLGRLQLEHQLLLLSLENKRKFTPLQSALHSPYANEHAQLQTVVATYIATSVSTGKGNISS